MPRYEVRTLPPCFGVLLGQLEVNTQYSSGHLKKVATRGCAMKLVFFLTLNMIPNAMVEIKYSMIQEKKGWITIILS